MPSFFDIHWLQRFPFALVAMKNLPRYHCPNMESGVILITLSISTIITPFYENGMIPIIYFFNWAFVMSESLIPRGPANA